VGSQRGPRPTESIVNGEFTGATLAQMVDRSFQLALRIGDQFKSAGKVKQDGQQRRHFHLVQQQADRFETHPSLLSLMPNRSFTRGPTVDATNVVEHPEVVSDRILDFARVVGRENVIAGTDCGLGGRVHPQLVWAKLAALVEGAKLATKELSGS